MLGPEEIAHRFGSSQGHRGLRHEVRAFADYLDELLPDCREKSLAFTALQEASMWAHSAIATNARPDPGGTSGGGLGDLRPGGGDRGV